MAARQLQRRLHSILFGKQTQSSLLKEPSWKFLSSAKAFFNQDELYRRNIQTHAELSNQDEEVVEKHKTDSSKQVSCSDNSLSLANNNSTPSVEYTAISSLKPSPRHDLAMIFTCKVCDTRSMKTVCRESYEKGVVVARCGGCNNLHLIADRLGWFGEPGSIEELLASRGEEVKKGSLDTMSLTLEDLAGMKS